VNKRGFTLIELIMIIVLIGIISATVVPSLFQDGATMSVSATARKIADDIRYTQALAMARHKLTATTATNPAFRFRIRFNVADTDCSGSDQYNIVSDQDNDGTWGENPNGASIIESAIDPVTRAGYFCVQLNTGDFTGIAASVNFGGSEIGTLEFDSVGIPYDSDGSKLTVTKTITVSKGGQSASVVVTPNTGRVYLQ
jgi:prepilin-type N-terminal cleavage/methylation domain-containing protein